MVSPRRMYHELKAAHCKEQSKTFWRRLNLTLALTLILTLTLIKDLLKAVSLEGSGLLAALALPGYA